MSRGAPTSAALHFQSANREADLVRMEAHHPHLHHYTRRYHPYCDYRHPPATLHPHIPGPQLREVIDNVPAGTFPLSLMIIRDAQDGFLRIATIEDEPPCPRGGHAPVGSTSFIPSHSISCLLACFSFSALLCLLVVKFADDQPALSDSPTHRSALFRGTSRSLQPCSVCIICPLRSAILH